MKKVLVSLLLVSLLAIVPSSTKAEVVDLTSTAAQQQVVLLVQTTISLVGQVSQTNPVIREQLKPQISLLISQVITILNSLSSQLSAQQDIEDSNDNDRRGGGSGGSSEPETPVATAVNGTCGSSDGVVFVSAPLSNLCSTGTAGSVGSMIDNWIWTCAGSNGGETASCSAPKESAVFGVCGSSDGVVSVMAPTSNLCSAGVASSVSSMIDIWIWTCAGSAGGETASCSAPKDGAGGVVR